jgi:hypothetical protein
MKLGKLTAAVLGVTATVLTMGAANAQYVTVGANNFGPAAGVNVIQPPAVIANNYPAYGYGGYAGGVSYVAPVGGSYVAGVNNGNAYPTGVNATVYNATAGVAPFAGYSGGAYNTPATAYSSVPVGTTPVNQVVGQLYDPVTESCFVRTDVYNYYTYDVYSGAGLSNFVGRYTDGPYYQTSYESSYAGACR